MIKFYLKHKTTNDIINDFNSYEIIKHMFEYLINISIIN